MTSVQTKENRYFRLCHLDANSSKIEQILQNRGSKETWNSKIYIFFQGLRKKKKTEIHIYTDCSENRFQNILGYKKVFSFLFVFLVKKKKRMLYLGKGVNKTRKDWV